MPRYFYQERPKGGDQWTPACIVSRTPPALADGIERLAPPAVVDPDDYHLTLADLARKYQPTQTNGETP